MIDIRSILIPKLTTALISATGRKIYDGMPIQLSGSMVFPCINISDCYIDEDGPKTSFQYKANILLEVIHKNLTSLNTLYSDMNKVKSIITNGNPFALDGIHKIIDCILLNSTTTKASIDRGLVDIGLIRVQFRVE